MCLMRGVSLKRVDALRVERVDLHVMGYMIPRRSRCCCKRDAEDESLDDSGLICVIYIAAGSVRNSPQPYPIYPIQYSYSLPSVEMCYTISKTEHPRPRASHLQLLLAPP